MAWKTGERINDFDIGYMINPNLRVNKSFREQVVKCMNNTFGALTQPFIKRISSKNNTSVLQLIIFHETRWLKPNKAFRVLSCAIYTILINYLCIEYLDCKSKQLSQISVISKHVEKYFNIILGIGIPYFLTNLLSCHSLSKNIKIYCHIKMS